MFAISAIFSYVAKVGLNNGSKREMCCTSAAPDAAAAVGGSTCANIQPAADKMPTDKINNHKTRILCDVGLAGLRPKLTCLTMLRVLLWGNKELLISQQSIESRHWINREVYRISYLCVNNNNTGGDNNYGQSNWQRVLFFANFRIKQEQVCCKCPYFGRIDRDIRIPVFSITPSRELFIWFLESPWFDFFTWLSWPNQLGYISVAN